MRPAAKQQIIFSMVLLIEVEIADVQI